MAEPKRYYWLRLHDDFFDSKRIKKLRRMAGGDTYVIIYLKLQLVAMKTNGVLEYTGLEENFAEEMALEIDEETDNVKVTLAYLLHCGLAETSDNVNFFFPYALANTGGEGESAKRMRNLRKRAEASQSDGYLSQCDGNVSHCSDSASQCNGGSSLCDREKEKKKYIEIDTISSPPNPPSRGAADEVEEERKGKKRKILPPDIPESIRGAWDAFVEMRRRISKPMTDYAKQLAYRELCKLSTDPEIQVKILDQSTLNGWQGLFALKEEKANTAKPAASQKASGFGNFDPLQAFNNALSRSLGSEPKEGGAKA